MLFATLVVSCGIKTERFNYSKFEIKDQNGVVGIIVDDNGNIIINNKLFGKVVKTGKILDKKGKTIAELNNENILVDSLNHPLIKISKNGELDNGSGITIKWSKSGELMKGDVKTGMSISPNDPKSYCTASAILFLSLSF